jgi:hypothetical protein
MRNLTIKREKHFVGCLGTMKVYIEDPQQNDMIINGFSCRKLGTLKNGQEKTFSVSESAAKVYVIADKLSVSFCNEYYPLPEGTEDVVLTGRNHFNPAAGNAFRFDGVADLTVLEHRKKTTNKGIIVLVVALVIATILGSVIGGAVIGVKFAKEMISSMNGPKEFRVDDLRITLTGEFSEVSAEDCSGAFQGRDVTVLVSRYDRGAMGNPTLTQFAKAVRDTNNHDVPLREDEYFWYYELDMQDSKSGKPLHYFVMFYKNPVDFYIVQFAVPQEKTEEYRQQVMEWARSVNVN